MKQIEVKQLQVFYDKKRVLTDISFDVYSKDYIAIVGDNGSGKSTLLKALLGLVPSKGMINFNVKKNEIGYLAQKDNSLKQFPASVFEVVLSGCIGQFKFFYNKHDKEKALQALKKFKIEHLKNKNFSELSGGQMQRVLLAKTLCTTKKVLVLDEPTTGLDSKTIKDFYKIIDDLNKEGITILMVTHDIEASLLHANKILHINNTMHFFDTTDKYRECEKCSLVRDMYD